MEAPSNRLSYYRPISSVSFGLNYLMSGLNPFWYHFVNLTLHGANICLVFLVGFWLFDDEWASFLGAVFFAIHPMLIEIIPAMDRRQDLLMLFFLLGAFLVVQLTQRGVLKKFVGISLSSLLFVLALGSKENAIIFLPIVYCYFRLNRTNTLPSHRRTLIRCSPYLVVAAVFLLLRWAVLGQWGGPRAQLYLGIVKLLALVVSFFSSAFFYGINFFTTLKGISVPPLIGLFLATVLYFTVRSEEDRTFFDFFRRSNPFYVYGQSRYVLIAGALLTSGLWWFDRVYLGRNDYWFFVELLLVVGVIYFLVNFVLYYFTRNSHHNNDQTRLFLVVWWVLPLGLSLVTMTINFQSMYVALVPFSLLMGEFISETILQLGKKISWNHGLFLGGVILIYSSSPIFINYKGWECFSKFTGKFLTRINQSFAQLPEDRRSDQLVIKNYPDRFSFANYRFQAQTMDFPVNSGIKAWLKLSTDGPVPNQVILRWSRSADCGESFRLERFMPTGTRKNTLYRLNWASNR
jgi:hypothetical protein